VRALVLVAIAGCSAPSTDIVGPFQGAPRRFVVDSITIPRDTQTSDALAGDLDGDGTPENQLGVVTAVLSSIGDLTIDGQDMIRSGALLSTVELQGTPDRSGIFYVGGSDDASIGAGGGGRGLCCRSRLRGQCLRQRRRQPWHLQLSHWRTAYDPRDIDPVAKLVLEVSPYRAARSTL